MSQDPTKAVQISDNYVDLQSKNANLVADTSTALTTILGAAVSSSARGVEINVGAATVHYSPSGAATTGNAKLPTVRVIPGDKAVLDAIRLIGASGETPNVSLIVFGDDGLNG